MTLRHPSWLFRRMHEKVVVVDRERYIAGGRNLAEAYFGMARKKNYVDRDVYVETYADVPTHLRDDLARDGREKFYDDWLNRRARQLGVHGVFVLVTRSPGRVQVGVDRATQRTAFTADDREALRDALVAAFRGARYDQGLLDGLHFIKRRMDENAARERSPTVPVAGVWN